MPPFGEPHIPHPDKRGARVLKSKGNDQRVKEEKSRKPEDFQRKPKGKQRPNVE